MMRINEIVNRYEVWGAKPFVDSEHIYDELQFIQAYCDGVKPIVYCSEILGQLLFGMAYNIKKKQIGVDLLSKRIIVFLIGLLLFIPKRIVGEQSELNYGVW